MKRSRALGLSLLLHALLLLWVWQLPAPEPQKNARPLTFMLVEPKAPPREEPTRAANEAPRPLEPPARRPSTTTAPLVLAEAPTSEIPPDTANTEPTDRAPSLVRKPKSVDLFPSSAVGALTPPASEDPSQKDGDDLAQVRLNTWRDNAAAERRADHLPPHLKLYAEKLHDWFLPSDRALEGAASLGLGALSMAKQFADNARQSAGAFAADENPEDLVRKSRIDNVAPGENHFVFCFGACGGGSHEVAALAVRVDVDHDASGTPATWKVSQSSGDRGFDTAALEAVRDALAYAPPDLWKLPPPPKWSRWELSARAYRWGRGEMLLDPQWTPPGRELEQHSGILGKTTVVRGVSLLAVTYHGGAQSQ